jgi:hypothetical protein
MPEPIGENNKPEIPLAPNSVITPGSQTSSNQAPNNPAPQPPALLPPPVQLPEAPVSEPSFYNATPEPTAYDTSPSPEVDNRPQVVTWTASEFIAHDKSMGWYTRLALATIIFGGLVYLFDRSIVSLVVIVVAAIVFGLYAGRKPRQLQYQIDLAGLTIGSKLYHFEDFKSFSVVSTGAFTSINFMPLKRFAPILSIFYSPEDEKDIMAVLKASLPYEDPRLDMIDTLMRKIRF